MQAEKDRLEIDYKLDIPPEGNVTKPVVFILGWAGSKQHDLSQYSSFYGERGYTTVLYTLPTDMMFLLNGSVVGDIKDISKRIYGILKDNNLCGIPVMFHVFSNAGAMLYRWTSEVFLEKNVSIVGVVMDSCPSRLELSVGLKAIYFVKRQEGILSYLSYLGRFVSNGVKSRMDGNWNEEVDVYQELKSSASSIWPHLFLHSTNDGVIPSSHILEIADSRKVAGASIVRTMNFEHSVHVSHFKKYKEKYIDECQKFASDCWKQFQDNSKQ